MCEIDETMSHILTDCDAPGSKTLWKLANRLWEMRIGKTEITPTLGTILGCGLSTLKNGSYKPDKGLNRLYRIIVSETAHLIWRVRCERRIGRSGNPEKFHTKEELRNRWIYEMNQRLRIDCALTNNLKYGKRAMHTYMIKIHGKAVYTKRVP